MHILNAIVCQNNYFNYLSVVSVGIIKKIVIKANKSYFLFVILYIIQLIRIFLQSSEPMRRIPLTIKTKYDQQMVLLILFILLIAGTKCYMVVTGMCSNNNLQHETSSTGVKTDKNILFWDLPQQLGKVSETNSQP